MRPNDPVPPTPPSHQSRSSSDYTDDHAEASSSHLPNPSSFTTIAGDDMTMPYDDDEIEEEKHDHGYDHGHHPDWSASGHALDTHHTSGYISGDHDMDDGGAPIVNYLDIANILTNDVDMDHESENEGNYGEVHQHAPPPAMHSLPPFQHVFPLGPPPYATDPTNVPLMAHAVPYGVQHPHNQHVPMVTTHNSAPVGLDEGDDDEVEGLDGVHPTALSNPNQSTLGPENPGVFDFLRYWAWQSRVMQGIARERGRFPWIQNIISQVAEDIQQIQYSDLRGERCDFQGVDWENLGVTRREARERRLLMYKNYVNIPSSDTWKPHLDVIPRTESYVRFRRMDIRRDIHLCHFQLRSVLASTSRSQIFYAGAGAVHEFNPVSGQGQKAMVSEDNPSLLVSTLAADHGTLIAGGFGGEYCLRRLNSDIEGGSAEVHEGTITADIGSGITNHVQLHQSRGSNSPRAAFASNDSGFRVLDIATEKFVSGFKFDKPLNCTAMSPDRRLRVMVGDHCEVLITNAESEGRPQILQSLTGHRDYGFSCDWADDGWTVATGCQDKAVKIWDARRWTDSKGVAAPVCTLRSEMAGVRSLRFSPLGSGKRILVAAEEADFVNIIDAQTFRSKQTFDVFGEIGGVSFTNDGQDIHVLCCDRIRGGLIQLERCRVGAEASHDPDDEFMAHRDRNRRGTDFDWPEFSTTPRRIGRQTTTRRRRRGAALSAMEPY